jgi:hypothetical protein
VVLFALDGVVELSELDKSWSYGVVYAGVFVVAAAVAASCADRACDDATTGG